MHPDTVMSQPQASPSARRGRPLKRFHSGKTPGKPHTNRNEKSTGTSEEPTKIQHLAHKRCNRPDVDCGLFRALGDPELSRAQNTSGHQLPRFFNPIRSKNASQSHKRPKILRQFGPIGEKEPQDGLKALVSREDPFGSLKEPKQDGPNASSRRKPSAPGNSFGAIGRYSAATWQYGSGKRLSKQEVPPSPIPGPFPEKLEGIRYSFGQVLRGLVYSRTLLPIPNPRT